MFAFLVRLIRSALPHVLRFLRMLFFLAITSLTSIWVGVPKAVNRISDNWVSEAALLGIPRNYDHILHYAGLVVASITLLLGWIVIALLSTLILEWIF